MLLTVDQGISYQQNLHVTDIAVFVMFAASNRLADLLSLVPELLAALESVEAGDVVEVRI